MGRAAQGRAPSTGRSGRAWHQGPSRPRHSPYRVWSETKAREYLWRQLRCRSGSLRGSRERLSLRFHWSSPCCHPTWRKQRNTETLRQVGGPAHTASGVRGARRATAKARGRARWVRVCAPCAGLTVSSTPCVWSPGVSPRCAHGKSDEKK